MANQAATDNRKEIFNTKEIVNTIVKSLDDGVSIRSIYRYFGKTWSKLFIADCVADAEEIRNARTTATT